MTGDRPICMWCGIAADLISAGCDVHPGDLAKLAAIEAVETSQADYSQALHRAIELTATALETYTSDDVWRRLAEIDRPAVPAAMGPAMKAAQKLGIHEPSGEWRESDRAIAHRQPKRVWRSLIYRPVRIASRIR